MRQGQWFRGGALFSGRTGELDRGGGRGGRGGGCSGGFSSGLCHTQRSCYMGLRRTFHSHCYSAFLSVKVFCLYLFYIAIVTLDRANLCHGKVEIDIALEPLEVNIQGEESARLNL